MSHIDEGNNGRIYSTRFGVKKHQKRNSSGHDILTQKRIHSLAYNLATGLNLKKLYVAKVNLENHYEYEMEKISTENIVYPGSPNHGTILFSQDQEVLLNELASLWIALWHQGFAAWDYELFLQPDGRIAMIDFDKFGFHMTSGPVSITMPCRGPGFKLEYFFQNPCFSYDFVNRLRALGFEPPADCLPTL